MIIPLNCGKPGGLPDGITHGRDRRNGRMPKFPEHDESHGGLLRYFRNKDGKYAAGTVTKRTTYFRLYTPITVAALLAEVKATSEK
ncbi:hypothetical protein [Arcticibacter sp.]|uniref:hypothetical protein n=1 Tax=Arcticibacter sp. TaxID=1872630 RepID=UPI00388ECA64